ncbi:hypothetical protein ACHAXT_010863 [Thalassiosira profunda]
MPTDAETPPADGERLLLLLQEELRVIFQADVPPSSKDLVEVVSVVKQLNGLDLPRDLEKRKAKLLGILKSRFGVSSAQEDLNKISAWSGHLLRETKALQDKCLRVPTPAKSEEDVDEMLLEATEYGLRCDQYWARIHEIQTAVIIDALVNGDGNGRASFSRVKGTLEFLQDSLVEVRQQLISKKRFKVQKPVFQVNDSVYARLDRYADNPWELCVVESRADQVQNHGYGPLRTYEVYSLFGEDNTVFEVADDSVRAWDEYSMCTGLLNEHKTNLIGVRNVTDEDAPDPWARKIGWYCALIDGTEEHFATLTAALRAHDSEVMARKLFDAQSAHLNMDWDAFANHLRFCDPPKEWTYRGNLRTRMHLILSRERARNTDMKLIGDLLIKWTLPKPGITGKVEELQREVEYSWREAVISCRDNHFSSSVENVRTLALLLECYLRKGGVGKGGWIEMWAIFGSYISAKGDLATFLDSVPNFRRGYILQSGDDMKKYISTQGIRDYGRRSEAADMHSFL